MNPACDADAHADTMEFRKEEDDGMEVVAGIQNSEKNTVTHGFAGRAAAVHPAALGLDVVLLPLAEVAEQPPRAAARFARYTFFLGTGHKDGWRNVKGNGRAGRKRERQAGDARGH